MNLQRRTSFRRMTAHGAVSSIFAISFAVLAFEAAEARVIGSVTELGRRVEPSSIDADQSGLADPPARIPRAIQRSDTLWYGYVQTIAGVQYAVPGEVWTFDHGAGGTEGWYSVDVPYSPGNFARRIDAAGWEGHGNGVPAPILSGAGSAWIGAMEDEADALCWESGLGYGNFWCQRWVSPPISYAGAGDVTLDFDYFNESEPTFDFTHVRLELSSGDAISLNGAGFDGVIGDPATHSFAHAQVTVSEAVLEGHESYRLVFEFTADGGWSDEDGQFESTYGGFGADDVILSGPGAGEGLHFDFEAGEQGWSAERCGSVGSLFGIAALSDYTVLDLCACGLAGHVVELHAGSGDLGTHPVGQHESIYSPIIDKSALGAGKFNVIGEWDQYSDLPQANGVVYRTGWTYYPQVCPETGQTQWSDRVGRDVFFNGGSSSWCRGLVDVGGGYVPDDALLVRFVYELFASCDALGIPSTVCTGVTNFTPLIDNVRVGVTQIPNAPVISFDFGGQFQDGFGKGQWLATSNYGNADITQDLYRADASKARLGDSLVVRGALYETSAWDARLWWRIRREGPNATFSQYQNWKDQVRDGLDIVGPSGRFTFGRMDSAQIGTQVYRDRFISEFREDDDDFAGEETDNNEMIRDGILPPGTQIEYFVTSNYTCSPSENFYLPDTTGGNYLEFEVLPSWRASGGHPRFPCLLTIDLNTGEQPAVESALNVLMNGAGFNDPIPNPTLWDRYDYNDASSNWNAPFARQPGSNNGVPFAQLMGYRQVILYTGRAPRGSMETADFSLLGEWLTSVQCSGRTNRQGFIGAGDDIGGILHDKGLVFLVNNCGATDVCDAYQSPCGSDPVDESACVRLEAASGAAYAPLIEYDLHGNWCPQKYAFDVLGKVGSGVGNRVYRDYDRTPPTDTRYAQITNSITGSNSDNYRSVLSGYAFSHLSTRDAVLECVGDAEHTEPAIVEELRAAMRWIFDGDANRPSLCDDPCFCCSSIGETESLPLGVTCLLGNSPNPFNPRTELRFSVGAAGPAKLTVYDVNGRAVRKLVDATLSAGDHSVVWDGTDDDGHKLGAGVYWSQLRAGGFESQKKMILLR